MNERIKELAEQAKIDYELLPEIAREPVWVALDDELENFAKLIINECLTICEQLGDEGKDGHYCADKISKTFRS